MVDLDAAESGEEAGSAVRKRDRSLIEFPYADLPRSEELTAKAASVGARVWIDQTQLAVALDMSVTGGTFRGRLSAARMFGFIETEAGKVRISDLGLRLLEEDLARAARVEAFLRVPLYAAMYESYNGFALPPAAAVERRMMELGVPQKQAERARQVFWTSAQAASFIASNGRFAKPALAPAPVKEEEQRADKDDQGNGNGNGGGNGTGGGGGAGGGGGGGGLHPFVEGLLQTLPEPGTDWDASARADWLSAAATMFKLIYKGGGNVTVKAEPQTNTGANQ